MTAAFPSHTAAFAPGRVNLIGEHTDYNDGLALPFAIDAGVHVSAAATGDQSIHARAVDLQSDDSYALGGEAPSPGGWRDFVRGMTAELAAAGLPVRGCSLEISGTIPRGAGLSSSAALEVSLALALLALADADVVPPWPLARICSRVENEWVGAQTGLLDQLASLCGHEHAAMRIDFRSGVIEPVPLELGDWRLVTLDSGVGHTHAQSGYNDRRRECAQACEELGISSLRELEPEMLDRLPAPLDARARHVYEENARVDAAVDALARGDLPELGRLLDGSHASLRDLYEVSVPQVDATVQRALDAGAAGARMMGGGFGGQVLALMPPDAPAPAGALEVRPGPGARVLER
ncbi:MAG: galactokinase [Solirubrobacteraceae bacterium]